MLVLEDDDSLFLSRWRAYSELLGIAHRIVKTRSLDDGFRVAESASAYLSRPLHYQRNRLELHRQMVRLLASRGIFAFPSGAVLEDYDDKVGQAWRLRATEIPVPDTQWFCDESLAMNYLQTCAYPIVAKLSSGAGSSNVRLLRSAADGKRYCRRLFSRGISPAHRVFSEVALKYRRSGSLKALGSKLMRMPATIANARIQRMSMPLQFGAILLQQFVPGALFDVRVTVVRDRAFVFKRHVRSGDFRASGSGAIEYPAFDGFEKFVRLAFDLANLLDSPMLAVDFVPDSSGRPLVIEYSYTFDLAAVEACEWSVGPDGDVRPLGVGPAEYFLRGVLALD